MTWSKIRRPRRTRSGMTASAAASCRASITGRPAARGIPGAWRLNFVVSAAGHIIGVQELEGNDFPVLRTVDTSSFLVPPARGRGYGKQMRGAVLALAFGPLQARAAITSAWHDNHASLGVSRALGYQPNGESLHAHGERVDVMVHMRLQRADWLASGAGDLVEITGFDACRPLFGLPVR